MLITCIAFKAFPAAIGRQPDFSHGYERAEIICNHCRRHLGHVYKDEVYKTPTDERCCVNLVWASNLKIRNNTQ
ncbi:hypothetical protein BDC45DRAFT_565449 [Circinella umbellata]|nr:hypothetical protein BDC45DRAFT_565449 [Circinella umbellata]